MPGKDVLTVDKLTKSGDVELLFKNFSFEVVQGERIALIAKDPLIISTLFEILAGKTEPDAGEVKWGVTTTMSYFPKDNNFYFESNLNICNGLHNIRLTSM